MSDHFRFHELTIKRVRPEASRSIVVTFDIPNDLKKTFAFQPGQYLVIRAAINGEEVRRSYSICSDLSIFEEAGEIEIGIRAVEGGLFSNWAVNQFNAGMKLSVMPPQGRFVCKRPGAKHRVGFAGGSGITPILSIMSSSLAKEPDSQFTLVYANRNTASVMFNESLQDLKDRYTGRVTLIHVLSRQTQEIELLQGRLDQDKVSAILKLVLPPQTIDEVFVCGPLGMMDATMQALTLAGVTPESIHAERFVTQGQPTRAAHATRSAPSMDHKNVMLTLILDGKQHQLPMAFDEKILDAGLAAGLDLPYSCRGGVCCTCRAKVMQGSVAMEKNFTLEEWETRQGFVLSCQSKPTSPSVTLSFDER